MTKVATKVRWDQVADGAVPIQQILARELSEAELSAVSGGYWWYVTQHQKEPVKDDYA